MQIQKLKIYLFIPLLILSLSGFFFPRTSTKNRQVTTLITAFQCDPGKTTFYSFPSSISSIITNHIYEGLTRINNKGNLELAIAKEVHLSNDKKEYLFILNESFWSDGSSLTAYDFDRHWRNILSTKTHPLCTQQMRHILGVSDFLQNKNCWEDVGIKALSHNELKITLNEPCSYFLHLLATPSFMPHHNKDEEMVPNQSNGPFSVESWQSGIRLLLKKNPYFRESESIVLDEIEMLFLEDKNLVISLLDQGSIDFAAFMEGVNYEPKQFGITPYRLHACEQSGITAILLFNKNSKPFHLRPIRKIFCECLKDIQFSHSTISITTPATTLISPNLYFRHIDPLIENTINNVSNELLLSTLQEFDIHPNTLEDLVIISLIDGPQSNTLLQINDMWERQIKIHINRQTPTIKQGVNMIYSGDFHLATLFYSACFSENIDFLHMFNKYGPLNSLVENETLLQEHLYAARTATDKDIATFHAQAAEKYLLEEYIAFPLYHPGYICGIREGLENISLGLFFPLIDLSRAYWRSKSSTIYN